MVSLFRTDLAAYVFLLLFTSRNQSIVNRQAARLSSRSARFKILSISDTLSTQTCYIRRRWYMISSRCLCVCVCGKERSRTREKTNPELAGPGTERGPRRLPGVALHTAATVKICQGVVRYIDQVFIVAVYYGSFRVLDQNIIYTYSPRSGPLEPRLQARYRAIFAFRQRLLIAYYTAKPLKSCSFFYRSLYFKLSCMCVKIAPYCVFVI